MKPGQQQSVTSRAHARRSPTKSAWKAAEEYGCDMSLIEVNLRKTPAQRILAHRRSLQTLTLLREAMEKRHARS